MSSEVKNLLERLTVLCETDENLDYAKELRQAKSDLATVMYIVISSEMTYRMFVEQMKSDGLTLNALEAEGGLRSMIYLSNQLEDYGGTVAEEYVRAKKEFEDKLN